MYRFIVAGLATSLLLPLGAGGVRAQTPPIDGNWEVSWDMQGGPHTLTLDLQRNGNVLTGTAHVQGMMQSGDKGEREFPISEGRIEGDHVFFQIRMGNGQMGMHANLQGQADHAERVMQFTGVVGSQGVMGGFLTGASMMQGIMTGAKGKPAMEIPFKGIRR
jgi:hypothetical protein